MLSATDRYSRDFQQNLVMRDCEFVRLSEYIHTNFGIRMPDSKKTMLEARLQKRLRYLGMTSFEEYCRYVFSDEGIRSELVQMIDVVTTNKTDFFREPGHFDYLTSEAVPELMRSRGVGVRTPLRVWSAGCSTGEEPYTLAMILSEFARSEPILFSIFATDISTRVLEKARGAIYEADKVAPIPEVLKKRYLMRSKDPGREVVRIVPELRNLVSFERLNFMDEDFDIRERFDIIFCRNVIIYFDRQTQEKLLNKFSRHLVKGGYVFMGHSETLNGLDVPLTMVHPTVYRKLT